MSIIPQIFLKRKKNWDIRLENHYISSFKSLTLGLKFGKMSIYQSETTKEKKKNVGDVAIREKGQKVSSLIERNI